MKCLSAHSVNLFIFTASPRLTASNVQVRPKHPSTFHFLESDGPGKVYNNSNFADLKPSDTGLYTCTASSESGETSWSAYITVEDPKNPNIIFHRTPDPATFPAPPNSIKVVDRESTSVTLSWRKDQDEGASSLIGYTIEYYCSDLQTGWVVAAIRVNSQTYTVTNLKPDTSYIFVVRAENSHGMSVPSEVSEHVKTLKSQHLEDYVNVEDARDDLLTKLIEIVEIEPISSTSVRLTWKFFADTRYLEGFYIR